MKILLLASFAAVFQLVSVSAQVAFTTLDSYGGYDFTTARGINGSGFRYGYQAWAHRFVSSRSGYLGSIELAVHYAVYDSAPSDQVDVRLARDVNGQAVSALTLSSGAVSLSTSFGSSGLEIYTPAAAVPMAAGSAYWLFVTPHFTSTVGDWNVNSIGATGTYAVSLDGVNWLQDSGALPNAFRVNLAPIPEPAGLTLAMIGMGAAGLSRVARRSGAL